MMSMKPRADGRSVASANFPRSLATQRLRRLAALAVVGAGLLLAGGCTTTGVLLGAAGVATDTSVSWEVVKYVHGKLTEGEPTACIRLSNLQRALNVRCGAFVAGSLQASDIATADLGECPLAFVARDPRLWPVLPELLDRGAQPEACRRSPLVDLAQAQPCPDFASASPAVRRSLGWLAQTDARAIHHDVVRMLSCPGAQAAGLDRVVVEWLAAGQLKPGTLGFSPLGALHPTAMALPLARELEAAGHTAHAALGGYDGRLASGFEEALRTSDQAALDWWFARAPELVNRVPPMQGNQLSWLPLARVLIPNFLADPATREQMVGFLMARGANPRQRLPADPGRTVIGYAQSLHSPLLALLDPPLALPVSTRSPRAIVAASSQL